MDKLTAKANAKVNLTLDITEKLPNGYHSIRSVMQSVSLHDVVSVERTNIGEIEVFCRDDNIPSGEQNIAFKAAREFFEYADIACPSVKISIEKHIPSEAGLGGGSADAAAVIVCLNKLFGCGFSQERLCVIGAKVGADVPFCIIGGTALCEGIGEVITPLSHLSCDCVLIAKGKLGISTKAAYAELDKTKIPHKEWEATNFSGVSENWTRLCSNDFEAVSGNSEIAAIKSEMKSCGAILSQMSGSGSAVFGVFGELKSTEICREKLISSGFFAEICSFSENGIEYL
ncbi:MAG: 4-(cytidine 5'-diphospho)-2-C-methyl-D-erythritol kinase [Oscillospiraceae bacterium]